MSTRIAVRMASLYDLHPLEVLLDKGIEESGGLLPAYDQHHVYHQAITRIQSGLIYVACDIDEAAKTQRIVGCLVMEARHFDWNPDVKLLESVHLYVLPEYRSKTLPDGKYVFEGLLAFGQGLADIANMPFVVDNFFQLGPENRAPAKDEAFKRAGFQYLGGKHFYAPKPPAQAGEAQPDKAAAA